MADKPEKVKHEVSCDALRFEGTEYCNCGADHINQHHLLWQAYHDQQIAEIKAENERLKEALKFCGKKREFEGTPRMCFYQAFADLNSIIAVAKQALSRQADQQKG